MSHPIFHGLPAWAMLPALLACLATGIGLGLLYFRALRWNADLFAQGGHAGAVLALTAGRFTLLAGALTLVSLAGAAPLLVVTLGLLCGRYWTMRRTLGATP